MARARQIAAERGGECLATENFSVDNHKVPWRCGDGHEWSAQLTSVRHGSWCPQCKNKSEEYCSNVMRHLFPNHAFARNIRSLEWMATGVGGSPLELDIYNEELGLALEFNGTQHEKPVDLFGGDDVFEYIVEHDRRKAEACEDAGVCLIVVWFSNVRKYGTGNRIDPYKTALAIWDAVSALGYPQGTHLPTCQALLAALNLE